MSETRVKPDLLAGVDLASIDALKALKRDADLLRSRRASMEALKADFAEPVYRRVDADYTKQLGLIAAQPFTETVIEGRKPVDGG